MASQAPSLQSYENLGAKKQQQSLAELQQNRAQVEQELARLEKQIYSLETSYLDETWSYGNVLKGFEKYVQSKDRPPSIAAAAGAGLLSGAAGATAPGFFDPQGAATAATRKKTFKESDRVFSGSSSSSYGAVTTSSYRYYQGSKSASSTAEW